MVVLPGSINWFLYEGNTKRKKKCSEQIDARIRRHFTVTGSEV